jgi:dolichyl-phosphate-mannose-protein mannosyltransferase
MTLPNRVRFACAAAAILIYFFTFAGPGLSAGFTHDDLMNLYGAWHPPLSLHLRDLALFFRFSDSYRPLGALFYRLLFDAVGFHPLPFRIACYALLLIDLWLAYCVARRISNSREVAALTVLPAAYHRDLVWFYINTGVCYDLLCFALYLAALLYYLRSRQRVAALRWRDAAVWSLLYVLALNAKEMAVTLPVMIAIYELLHGPPRSWRIPAIGGVLTSLFVFGRVLSGQGLASLDVYRPDIRPAVYLDHARHFLWDAFYQPDWMTPAAAAAIAALILAAAWLSRSTALRFGFAWMCIGILPVAFIRQRGLEAVCIPALGLAICVAAGIAAAVRHVAPQLRPALLFTSVFAALLAFQMKYGRLNFPDFIAESRHIQSVHDQLLRICPSPPPGSRLLFVRDPFPKFSWGTTFLAPLTYGDRTMQVQRLDRLLASGVGLNGLQYDFAFSWEQERFIAVALQVTQAFSPVSAKPEGRCAQCYYAYALGRRNRLPHLSHNR